MAGPEALVQDSLPILRTAAELSSIFVRFPPPPKPSDPRFPGSQALTALP